jgi:hypothetical protein
MFKLGSPQTDTTTTTPNLKMKKPEQESIIPRNNLKQTYAYIYIIFYIYFFVLLISRTKKEYVENAVKTAFDAQTPSSPPPQYNSSSSKANNDFLDRQLFEKADLDYIPGLDYDVGPVFIPSKLNKEKKKIKRNFFKKYF